MLATPFYYRARVERVIDGDTLDVLIDVGFHITMRLRLRLLGVNCPETNKAAQKEAGLKAKSFTEFWVTQHAIGLGIDDWPYLIRTDKSDVFGRYLATVYAVIDGACLNDDLLASGNAREDIRP